ncbi:hypothetical protein LC040_15575 [Bacillus tianshenii]|nr:hypothetical protein LC040_15575 [Bacillus tianshenii]
MFVGLLVYYLLILHFSVSLTAINDTKEINVSFSDATSITEDSLAQTTLTLTPAEGDALTASYKVGSLAENSAVFVIDAETVGEGTYTVTSDSLMIPEGTTTTYTMTATALEAVNNADAETIQAVLEANAETLSLSLETYNTLEDTYKSKVGTVVLNAKSIQPGGEYSDVAAVKIAFDNAVSNQAALQAKANATVAVNNVEIDAEAEDMEAATAAAIEEMQQVLAENATVLGIDFTDYETLVQFSKDAVAKTLVDAADYTNAAAVKAAFEAAVNTELTALNDAVDAVNAANDAAAMKTALSDNTDVLALATGADSDYAMLSESSQTAVANAVLENRPEDDEATENVDEAGYKGQAAIQAAFDIAVADQKVEATAAAVTAVNNASTASETKVALEAGAELMGLNLEAYSALGDDSQYQTAVAEAVLDGKAVQANGEYATAEAVKAVFEVAVENESSAAISDVVATVNNVELAGEEATAEEIATMKAVLEANADVLGLEITGEDSAYVALGDDSAYQTAVAEAVLENRPAEGYSTTTSVKAEFDTAVDTQAATKQSDDLADAIAAVNNAADAAALETVLETEATYSALGLAIGGEEATAYDQLTDAGQDYVAQAILDAKLLQDNQVYANAEAIQEEFNTAVTYRSQVEAGKAVTDAIAAVNGAADAAALESVLETEANYSALGLSVEEGSAYAELRDNFQTEVAAAMLEAKPETNFATKAAVQTAFTTAVTEQTEAQEAENAAITAVNEVSVTGETATDAEKEAMVSVLEANAAILSLGDEEADMPLADFNALSEAAKLSVAEAVFTARPAEGFALDVGKTAIETAFEAEVATQVAAQATAVNAINAASTTEAMITALTDNADSLALDLTDFEAFEEPVKAEIAQVVIDGKLAQPSLSYSGAAQIKAVFTNAVDAVLAEEATEDQILEAVNTATAETMQEALLQYATNLDLAVGEGSDYDNLGDAYKSAVAVEVFENIPEDNAETPDTNEFGYDTLAAITAAFNTAVNNQEVATAVDKVNAALTVSSTQTALGNNAELLGLEGYADLTAEQKLEVATKVKNAKAIQPNGEFATAEAIQTVFNNVIYPTSAAISGTLAEATLDGGTVTVTLTNETFEDTSLDLANFALNNAPTGLTVEGVTYVNDTEATVDLAFDGTDFDTDVTNFSVTVNANELAGSANVTSDDLTISAVDEGFNSFNLAAADAGEKADGTAGNALTTPANSLTYDTENDKYVLDVSGDAADNAFELSLSGTTTTDVEDATGASAYEVFFKQVPASFDYYAASPQYMKDTLPSADTQTAIARITDVGDTPTLLDGYRYSSDNSITTGMLIPNDFTPGIYVLEVVLTDTRGNTVTKEITLEVQ